MPNLLESLQGRDLGHLRIIAALWELGFDAPDARVGAPRLAGLLLEAGRAALAAGALPPNARLALDDLLQSGGRLPWALFTRRHGALREMGPARRDRERPYGASASPAEALWYRGLLGRAFFDGDEGPLEHAYIPEDLLPLLPPPARLEAAPLGRPATPAERLIPISAGDALLDHAATLLAALRMGLDGASLQRAASDWSAAYPVAPGIAALRSLLDEARLLDRNGIPAPEPVRDFLEAPRLRALAQLSRAWLNSERFNELRLLPGLDFEGEWSNEPRRARQAVLELAAAVPEGAWWSLGAFLAGLRQARPDFQRPAGDYDSWYIRSAETGEYLRGFEHWEAVDGALARYILCGPLHWLGIVDLAQSADDAPPAAFRLTPWAGSLLAGSPPEAPPASAEDQPISAASSGRLFVPRLAPRSARYQIARFCKWEGYENGIYRYRLTPAALDAARRQGLRVGHLLGLLRRHAPGVPPALARALQRWDEHGGEARLQRMNVLRLASPELLAALRASRASRWLGDLLGPTAIAVKPGAEEKVLEVLFELGCLGEVVEES